MKHSLLIKGAGLVFISALVGGCSSSSSNVSGTSLTTSDALSSSGVFTSPFESTSGSAQVSKSSTLLPSTFTALKAKVDAMLAVTSGKVADCQALYTVDFSKFSNASASCYGPQVTLSGTHPDSHTGVSQANLPGGDLGIWDATDSGTEACSAAQINAVSDYAALVPFYALLTAAYTTCYIQNSGTLSLPTTAGSATTLSATDLASFGFTTGKDVLSATSAVVTGITDTAGDFGLRYEVNGTLLDGDITQSVDYKIVVQFAKASSGAETGTASYAFQSSTGAKGNCQSVGATGVTFAGKETFAKNAAGTQVDVELKHAEYCGAASPLDATTYDIDYSSKASSGTPTGWGDNANYVLMSFNPATLDGKYIFAWQAGKGDSHTRVFNATISTASGTQSGTSYFGFGDEISVGTAQGTIKGMICNWAGDSNNHTPSALMQQQMMTKTSGVWVDNAAAGTHIKYAPVNGCSYDPTGSAGNNATFRYNAKASAPYMMNDFSALFPTPPPANQAATVDLPALSTLSFTAPTAPVF